MVFIQFGNYAEAERRFAAGAPETYHAQRYSVEAVAKLRSKVDDLSVVCVLASEPEVLLPSGVRALGIELFPRGGKPRYEELWRTLERLAPDRLIVGAPLTPILWWARRRGIRTLPLFADSFQGRSWRDRIRQMWLALLLRSKAIDWVSNHSLAASLDLVRIGVPRAKVLPFDWPALLRAKDRAAKKCPEGDEFRVIYVGVVNEAKGVGDLIDAVALLRADGLRPVVRASIVGNYDDSWPARIRALGLESHVTLLGRMPHEQVVEAMSAHDAVVVPSRPEYPEGLPMTLYEGVCSRSPLLISDHPMFRLKFRHEQSALVFRAGEAAALASSIRRLAADSDLYERLSLAAESTADAYLCPLALHELLERWVSGTAEDHAQLATFSLASGRYA